MQIRWYDEVDAHDVFRLNLAAFGRGLSEDWVRLARRRDPRVSDGYAIYAVEGRKPVAQVIPERMPVRLTSGPEVVGAVAGVCAHPGVWGRGYAAKLMERAHDLYRDLGLRISALATSRNIRGYVLYRKLGYVDLAPFYRATRRLPSRRLRPQGYRLRTATRRDLPRMQSLFEAYTRDLFGWTLRSPDLLPLYAAWDRKELDPYRVLLRDREVVGYVRVGSELQGHAEEVIAPKFHDFRAAVRLLESKARRVIATAGDLTARQDLKRYRSIGYDSCGPIPSTTMAVPLERGVKAGDLPALFGAFRGRFVHYATDDF